MNGDTSTTPGDSGEIDLESVKTALVSAIEELLEQDERWHPVPSPGGSTLTRGWDDESVDTVLILSPDTAYAWREDPRGRETLRIRGTAEQVLAAVGRWPGPSEPKAPDGSDHLPGPSGRWT